MKPGNILIDEHGAPHVTDFGLAKRINETDALTLSGTVMGTPQYMPPEQASGLINRISVESDVYSLGAILYEMLTLRPPFQADTQVEILLKVKTEDPVAPRKLRATVDRDLETVCMKCLEKEQSRRYRSAEELAEELERWLRGEPIVARPHSAIERTLKWVRRHPAKTASLVLGTALVLVLIGSVLYGNEVKRRAEQQAEQQKIAERDRTAAAAAHAGIALLQSAKQAGDGAGAERDKKLLEAEERFRVALFFRPDHAFASAGLRDAAMLHYNDALLLKDWRQAREKLMLARSAGLPDADYNAKGRELALLESARENQIRTRVAQLMADAASPERLTLQEFAVNELIALKDPLTVTLLAGYISHDNPECRKLALAALTWIGDASIVPKALPYIQPKTPDGADNPEGVQVAAITAVCLLGGKSDAAAYAAIGKRINMEPSKKGSLFYERINGFYEELGRRVQVDAAAPRTAAAWIARAVEMGERNKFREEKEAYDQALLLEPRNVEALIGRGRARHTMHDYLGALADFQAAEKLGPPNAELLNFIAGDKIYLRDFAGALADLDKVVALNPNIPETYCSRGNCLSDLGRHEEALKAYDHALELSPKSNIFRINRAHARADLRDYEGAIADFKEALKLDPRCFEAFRGMAEVLTLIGKYKEAIAEFEKAMEVRPGVDLIYYKKVKLEAATKNSAAAIKDLHQALRMNPKNADAYFCRAMAKGALNDMTAALADFDQAIRNDPQFVEAWINRGGIRVTTGDYKGGLEDLTRAIEIEPRSYEAYVNRAIAKWKLEDEAGAFEDLDRALELAPDKSKVYTLRAKMHQEKGRKTEALADFKKAFDLTPLNHAVYQDLSNLYTERQDWAARLDLKRRHLAAQSTNSLLLNDYALELLECKDESLRDPEKALESAQRAAMVTNRKQPGILSTLALALFRTGKKAEAIETIKKAIALLPANGDPKVRADMEAHLKEFEAGK